MVERTRVSAVCRSPPISTSCGRLTTRSPTPTSGSASNDAPPDPAHSRTARVAAESACSAFQAGRPRGGIPIIGATVGRRVASVRRQQDRRGMSFVVGEMKFALYGLHRNADGPEVLRSQARAAEEAGFEGLWVGDHVALPSGPGDELRLEALVALTFLAAATSRIRHDAGSPGRPRTARDQHHPTAAGRPGHRPPVRRGRCPPPRPATRPARRRRHGHPDPHHRRIPDRPPLTPATPARSGRSAGPRDSRHRKTSRRRG
jgi:hypothetical protein